VTLAGSSHSLWEVLAWLSAPLLIYRQVIVLGAMVINSFGELAWLHHQRELDGTKARCLLLMLLPPFKGNPGQVTPLSDVSVRRNKRARAGVSRLVCSNDVLFLHIMSTIVPPNLCGEESCPWIFSFNVPAVVPLILLSIHQFQFPSPSIHPSYLMSNSLNPIGYASLSYENIHVV